ncbi:craniofacial development protein 2-like isoform X2 [Moschus berezovskii]|uniref:craniofacial development protein 2-like isoform X2 n=1 Tax=Moschus berezovskii TaxID=68408 RepID=UPI002444D62F|nr:craniofacial development protein 2-like isoform X2 [Moschus berezovskii]
MQKPRSEKTDPVLWREKVTVKWSSCSHEEYTGDWNAKAGSQETPGETGKFGLGVQNEAGQMLVDFSQENALVIENSLFQWHKRRFYTWTHQMTNTEIRLIIFFATKDGEAVYSQQKQDRELTGSDNKFLITKFRCKLKKVGKTTRTFRYDLNQIPNDDPVEVRNRFKGLDLIDCLMNYGLRLVTSYRRQGARPFSRKRRVKKQNGYLRRPYK